MYNIFIFSVLLLLDSGHRTDQDLDADAFEELLFCLPINQESVVLASLFFRVFLRFSLLRNAKIRKAKTQFFLQVHRKIIIAPFLNGPQTINCQLLML